MVNGKGENVRKNVR